LKSHHFGVKQYGGQKKLTFFTRNTGGIPRNFFKYFTFFRPHICLLKGTFCGLLAFPAGEANAKYSKTHGNTLTYALFDLLFVASIREGNKKNK
jgi:hypothetical protein